MFKAIFGAPKKVCDAAPADDSGIGAKPSPGSRVHPGRRLMRNQVLFFADAFSKASMDELVPRFLGNLRQHCSELDSGDGWIEWPDLYDSTHDTIFRCAVGSLVWQEHSWPKFGT